ncbi:MAG: hypothetical protein LBT41_01135 [Candidatus Methanoplasma sp.]|nr:hypothetical protein [Candidatus Methanoplasma sp.]
MSFCVRCGKDAEGLIDGMCAECFLGSRKPTTLPHHVDLFRCTNCGEFRKGEDWSGRPLEQAVEGAAEDSLSVIREADVKELSVSFTEQDPYTFLAVVDTVIDVNGCEVADSASVIVRLKNTVCKRCSRQLGGYYESILQIRTAGKEFPDRLRDEVLNRIGSIVAAQSRTNRGLFITKMELVTGGPDLYLSSISLGRSLAKDIGDSYCAETKEAAKLVGQTSDGQDMYRVTYLVRLPDYHVGDVVRFENRYYKMTRVSAVGGKAVDVVNFRERAIKRSDMQNVKVYEKASDLRSATVVSRSPGEIQILHPSDYSTLDLKIPDDAEIEESVKVTEIDGVLYYVP